MDKNGPVIVIEDDIDDQDMFNEIFKKLEFKNPIVFFTDGNKALEYLKDTDIIPFLIISDINMSQINGFELRNKIHANERLHLKGIPYLFFTTSADKKSVIEAYALSVQGFFVKPDSFKKMESTIKKIMDYWRECIAPNEFE
ncbi:MAG: response regulator [Bacteroidia bacterium]|nr:response regulator [Bacteroidia bacterium]